MSHLTVCLVQHNRMEMQLLSPSQFNLKFRRFASVCQPPHSSPIKTAHAPGLSAAKTWRPITGGDAKADDKRESSTYYTE